MFVMWLYEWGFWHPLVGKGQRDDIEPDCTFREGFTLYNCKFKCVNAMLA